MTKQRTMARQPAADTRQDPPRAGDEAGENRLAPSGVTAASPEDSSGPAASPNNRETKVYLRNLRDPP